MPRSHPEGKIWSFDVLSRLHSSAPLKRVLDVGPGEGTYIAFRQPGQYWIGAEAWAPYVKTYDLEKKYDQVVVADIRYLDLSLIAPLDLVICGDVLEHMSKDDALRLLDKLLNVSRTVLVSIPIVHAEQGDYGGNPFETHVKDDWTHEECMSSLPNICLDRKEFQLGVYILSRNESDRARLIEINAHLKTTEDATPPSYIVAAQNSVKTVRHYTYERSKTNLDEVVATLEEICWRGTTGAAVRSVYFSLLVHYKEAQQRGRKKASPVNAESIEDWKCQFTRKEITAWQEVTNQWLELSPDVYTARLSRAQSLIAANAVDAAEPYFAGLRELKRGDLASITHFDAPFHDALEQTAESFAKESRPVIAVRDPLADRRRFIFTACDYGYFKSLAWPLIASLARLRAQEIGVHLHLFDATNEEADVLVAKMNALHLEQVSISREWTGMRKYPDTQSPPDAKNYYHVARFFRFWQFLESRPGAAAWQLDADLMFNRSPLALFDHLAGSDVALWLLPGRFEAHNQIAAGFVGISPTPAGRAYLRRVAGYAAECLRSDVMAWGSDQTILYAVFAHLMSKNAAPRLAPVPASIYDGSFGDETVVWPVKCPVQSPDSARFRTVLKALKKEFMAV